MANLVIMVKFARALLACYDHTQESEYLDSAETVMDFIEGHFRDDESGLYRDRMEPGPGILETNALSFRNDPCGNTGALAALNWLRIAKARENPQAKANADRILKALEVFKANDYYTAAAFAFADIAP